MIGSRNSNQLATIAAQSDLTQNVMQKIEVQGTIDEQGYIHLNQPLSISNLSNVHIIVMVPEASDLDDYDEPDESVLAGLRQALSEVKEGKTIPMSELWNGIDE